MNEFSAKSVSLQYETPGNYEIFKIFEFNQGRRCQFLE